MQKGFDLSPQPARGGSRFPVRDMAFAAMIAALYTALCLALAPLSFGMVQVRVAEALTILPVFSTVGVWGVTLGCALSNLVGFLTGANILGYMDILFGTAATLAAAVLSHRLRNIRLFGLPVLSSLPPVLLNALVVGGELAFVTGPMEGFGARLLVNAVYVGAGQLLSCCVGGLALAALLERSGAARACFGHRS